MAGFLTDSDRADMLASLTASWTQSATITRNDGADNYGTIASAVPCRATASAPREVVIAGQIRSVTSWKINMPAGQDIKAQDRITIAGRAFEVNGVSDPLDQNLIRQVAATEIVSNA